MLRLLYAIGLTTIVPAAAPRNAARIDDPTIAPWARSAVEHLQTAKVVWGDPSGIFNGGRIARRFDAIVMLRRFLRGRDLTAHRTTGRNAAMFAAMTAVGLESAISWQPVEMMKDFEDPCFGGLSGASWLWENGFLQGFPDQWLRGKRSLSRGALAMICARMVMLAQGEAPMDAEKAHFSDLAGDEWYYGAVVLACGAGIMHGDETNAFHAARPVTRNELAVVLDRLATLLPPRAAD